MRLTENFDSFPAAVADASHIHAGESIKLSAEEIQARLQRNVLFLSDENQRAWSALVAQAWYSDVRNLAVKSSSVAEWVAAVDRIAQGSATAHDVKQAVFYRSAFRQSLDTGDDDWKAYVTSVVARLSTYLNSKLRPQHNHFA